MRKGRDLLGKPVIAYDTGEKFETVTDLVFDQVNNILLGFLVDEGGWFTSARVLPLAEVQAIGPDAVIVASRDSIVVANTIPRIEEVLDHNNILKDTRIMTVDGRDLGTMIDLYFDDQTGRVEGYEVSGGLFADAYSGRSFVPAPQTIKIGEDVAFIPSETADLMQEQIGGVRAAMQITGEKVQEVAYATSEKAKEVAQFTSEKAQAVGRSATNSIASLTVEQAQGRRVMQMVQTEDGYIVAAPGQIVTTQVIERAKTYDREQALLGSVGLSTTATMQTKTGAIASDVGSRFKSTASNAGEQIMEGAGAVWNQVQETASDFQKWSANEIEDRRVKGALGRPVTRAILDRQDAVILNVSELITHQSIEMARREGVLDILLSSVYTETPNISLDEMRAPEDGKAALSTNPSQPQIII
jgi:uncharacterized protein YrrD